MSKLSVMQSTDLKSVWRPWVVCLSAGLFFFYVFFQLNVFDVINPALREAFHISAPEIGWMSSSFVWANVLFLFPAGIILDRSSVSKVILLALAVCIVGTFGFALTNSFLMATIFHALTGAANAFCFLSCVVLVSRWFLPCRRALVIGCIVTMAFLGGMMAHTPLAYLYQAYGWRLAILLDGVIGLIIWLWILRFVSDSPVTLDLKNHIKKTNWLQDLTIVLSDRQTLCAGFYTACLNLPIMVLCALWGASYLQTVHNLSPINASNVVSLIFVGSIIGCPLMGWGSDRLLRRKPLMILGALATLCCIMPLLYWHPLSIPCLSLLFLGLGFFSSSQVISYPLIAESYKPEHIGLSTSIASILIMGGGGVGQIVFSFLMQQHSNIGGLVDNIANFQWAMRLFPVATLFALLIISVTRETYCGISIKKEVV